MGPHEPAAIRQLRSNQVLDAATYRVASAGGAAAQFERHERFAGRVRVGLHVRLLGPPAAVWGMFHRNGPTRVVSRVLFAAMASLARLSLCYGTRGVNELRATGVIPARKIRVVSTGLDLEHCDELQIAFPQAEVARFIRAKGLEGKILFLQVARLTPSKRTDLIIDSLPDVVAQHPEVVLVLVGDGPERLRLDALVQSRGLVNNVLFVGASFQERDLCLWFRSARAVVCAGAVGLLAHHAMAYATPMIAHDASMYHGPEAESIIHAETGLLYRREDSASLAAALNYAASHQAEMNAMGFRGRMNATGRYSIEIKAQRFRDAILELAKPSRRGTAA